MSIFRRQIVDGLSNLAVEVIAETVNKVAGPPGPRSPNAGSNGSGYVDVEPAQPTPTITPTSPTPRPSLPLAPPPQKAVPKPAQTGARPNPAYPAFPFPPPLELPPVAPASPPPTPPQNGPRPRGRPRRGANGNAVRPPLFPNGNAGGAPRLGAPKAQQNAPGHSDSDNDDEV